MRIGCPVAHGMGTTHVIVNRSSHREIGKAIGHRLERLEFFATVTFEDTPEPSPPKSDLKEAIATFDKLKLYKPKTLYWDM